MRIFKSLHTVPDLEALKALRNTLSLFSYENLICLLLHFSNKILETIKLRDLPGVTQLLRGRASWRWQVFGLHVQRSTKSTRLVLF